MNVTSADGTTIAYDQRGTGAPVILVGGAFNDRTTVSRPGRRLGCGLHDDRVRPPWPRRQR